MRMRIPIEFDLGSRPWTVRWMTRDEAQAASDEWGWCDCDRSVIAMNPKLKKETMALFEHKFLHELTHAIDHVTGRNDDFEDEGKTDARAGALHQFLNTKKGKLE